MARDLGAIGTCLDKDMLDGTNYSSWSCKLKNLLIEKGLWEVVNGDEVRPSTLAPSSSSSSSTSTSTSLRTEEQKIWHQRDDQALLLISLSVTRSIFISFEILQDL